MSKFLELNAMYDSENTQLFGMGEPAKVLIAVAAIQGVSMPARHDPKQYTRVDLVPSLAAYGETDHGETVVQSQRVVHVLETFDQIRAMLVKERGVIAADT